MTTAAAGRIFDRELLARRRERAWAASQGGQSFLLERVADDFAERLSIVRRTFDRAASIGSFDGTIARRLRTLPNVGFMVETEAAPRLAAIADGPMIVADDELLPFADQSLDLVVSGLSWQLVNDVPGTLAQIRRALKPDGLLLAALLGGETLKELRDAWVVAESETTGGVSPRVAPFADLRELGALLQRSGFSLPVADLDVVTVAYASPLALMRELKAMGASNPLVERSRSPVRRDTLARADMVYRERHGRPDGRVTATFEIVTLTAWVPHESQQKPLRPGSATARLADALGTTEQRLGRDGGS